MFYHLIGSVSEINQNSIVLDVNGIGFLIHTSLQTLSALNLGKNVKLFISESIGETNYDLYGFSELREKRFFELLISVSGVGPKVAISLLSSVNPDTLVLAIINDDAKILSSAPGIGKKTAQRIILELRDKIGAEASGISLSDSVVTKDIGHVENSAVSDAISALNVLGYNTAEISPFIKKGNWAGMSAEEIIRSILKNMI